MSGTRPGRTTRGSPTSSPPSGGRSRRRTSHRSLAAAGVDATVLVQTRSSLDETREFLATAAATPFIRGVVGWVDLTDPGSPTRSPALRAGPGGDRLVGIRHQVHDEPDPDWLLRDDVGRGIRAVGEAGLVYDLLVRTRELPAALDAGATPDPRHGSSSTTSPSRRSATTSSSRGPT